MYRKRLAADSVDDPIAHCQPPGSPHILSLPKPTKIVETPGVMLLLHEHDTTYRQILTDGRPLPEDPLPTWVGYSIGRWDRDVFVVTTSGLTERSWLDVHGHPHSEALVMTERFHRVDVGHMHVEVTYADPGTFTTPLTITQKLRLLPDQELIEFFCTDNEKDREHRQHMGRADLGAQEQRCNPAGGHKIESQSTSVQHRVRRGVGGWETQEESGQVC